MVWTRRLRVLVRSVAISGSLARALLSAASGVLAEDSADPVISTETAPHNSEQESIAGAPETVLVIESAAEPTDSSAGQGAVTPVAAPVDAVVEASLEAPVVVTPGPASMEDMAAYLGSVRHHVENDPALAAAYLVFWSELKAGTASRPDSADSDGTARYFEEIAALATTVSSEVRRQYGKEDQKFLAADVVKRTVATLSSKVNGSRQGAQPGATTLAVSPQAERLLANLDVLTRPNATAEGRYRFAGTLRTVASVGSSAEV